MGSGSRPACDNLFPSFNLIVNRKAEVRKSIAVGSDELFQALWTVKFPCGRWRSLDDLFC